MKTRALTIKKREKRGKHVSGGVAQKAKQKAKKRKHEKDGKKKKRENEWGRQLARAK